MLRAAGKLQLVEKEYLALRIRISHPALFSVMGAHAGQTGETARYKIIRSSSESYKAPSLLVSCGIVFVLICFHFHCLIVQPYYDPDAGCAFLSNDSLLIAEIFFN